MTLVMEKMQRYRQTGRTIAELLVGGKGGLPMREGYPIWISASFAVVASSSNGAHQMVFPVHPAFECRPLNMQRKESPVFDKCQSRNWYSTRNKTVGMKRAVQSMQVLGRSEADCRSDEKVSWWFY
jgi:hypothetical protein